jgi:hypothetical protein
LYDVARLFRDEVRALMDRLNIEPAEWWTEVVDLFLPEIKRAAQLQIRLGLGGIALVVRSELRNVRTRCYSILGERGLDFTVATGCERISYLFPDAGWLLKIGLSGIEPHSRLFCDVRPTLDELTRVLMLLDLPPSGRDAGAALLAATGAQRFRYFSVAPGDPLTLELYASREPESSREPSTLLELGALTGLRGDPRLEALCEMHAVMAPHGRQRYSIEIDGAGVLKGLKVEYSDTPMSAMAELVDELSASPVLARRRLELAARQMAMNVADHMTVRLEAQGPAQLSVYFNRLFSAVA